MRSGHVIFEEYNHELHDNTLKCKGRYEIADEDVLFRMRDSIQVNVEV